MGIASRCLVLCALVPAAAVAGGAQDTSQSIQHVANVAIPAVVHIEAEKGRRAAPELQELFQVYGLPSGPAGGPWRDEDVIREADGSGVIVSRDGRVFTNNHVVEGAVRVEVRLADQRRLSARVVGSDPRTDIAVLQIEAPGPFPYLALGDSDDVAIGELVVAVGNPFDFDSSVSLGVVSARGRRGLTEREIQDYIQTDAAVNPGNSGGPLIDMDAKVIGINTAIYAPQAEQNAGISFAIPSNMAARVAGDLQALGHVRRAWIGVVAATVEGVEEDPALRGAEVVRVMPGSPAENAGIRRGDVIVAAGHEGVPSMEALRALVQATPIGGTVIVDVDRAGTRVRVPIVAVEEHSVGTALDRVEAAPWWAGMTVVDPTADVLTAVGLPMGRGVIVGRVEPDSAAAKMGIVAGDRLVAVSGDAFDDLAALRDLLAAKAASRWVTVSFERAGVTSMAILPVPGR
jgi:S1-C subfamily serine protease